MDVAEGCAAGVHRRSIGCTVADGGARMAERGLAWTVRVGLLASLLLRVLRDPALYRPSVPLRWID